MRRLYRRIGLGLRDTDIGTLDLTDSTSIATDLISGPRGLTVANGVDRPAGDPWGDTDYTVTPDDRSGIRRTTGRRAIAAWIDGMVDSETPLIDWLTWFWHGHFVSALTEVKNPQFMIDQMRLFRREGAGDFGQLLQDVTIDAAMLLYLDGNGSTGRSPNENYSRELLELFTLGHGNYSEADIAAGARALSGWVIRRTDTEPRFVAARHDATAHQYLGVDGVVDVDTVVGAIETQPALATFIAARLAVEIIGPSVTDDAIARAALAFTAGGLSIDALIIALVAELEGGTDGGPIVSSPLLWYVAARRITGARPAESAALLELQAAGQVPWLPPNVSGWPSGAAWNNAAALVARFNLSALVASATSPDHPTQRASSADELATALGLLPFGDATRAALGELTDPTDRLTLALVSPEFVVI